MSKKQSLSYFSFDSDILTNHASLLLFKGLVKKLNLNEIRSKRLLIDDKRRYYFYLDTTLLSNVSLATIQIMPVRD